MLPCEQIGHVRIALLANLKSSFNFFVTGEESCVEDGAPDSEMGACFIFSLFLIEGFVDGLGGRDLQYRYMCISGNQL